MRFTWDNVERYLASGEGSTATFCSEAFLCSFCHLRPRNGSRVPHYAFNTYHEVGREPSLLCSKQKITYPLSWVSFGVLSCDLGLL